MAQLKPTLAAPWKDCNLGGLPHIIKLVMLDEGGYGFYVSNYRNLWIEHLSKDEVLDRNSNLNSSLEAPTSELLGKIMDVFFQSDDNVRLVDCRTHLEIEASSSIYGFPLQWKFLPKLTSVEQFSEFVVEPMKCMISEGRRREKELRDIIKSKDREIGNYIAGGAKLLRKNLQTDPFDKDVFDKKMQQNESNQDYEKIFDETGQSLYIHSMENSFKYSSKKIIKEVGLVESKDIRVETPESTNVTVTAEEHISPEKEKDEELKRRKDLDEKLTRQKAKIQDKNLKKRMKF